MRLTNDALIKTDNPHSCSKGDTERTVDCVLNGCIIYRIKGRLYWFAIDTLTRCQHRCSRKQLPRPPFRAKNEADGGRGLWRVQRGRWVHSFFGTARLERNAPVVTCPTYALCAISVGCSFYYTERQRVLAVRHRTWSTGVAFRTRCYCKPAWKVTHLSGNQRRAEISRTRYVGCGTSFPLSVSNPSVGT